MDIWLRGLMLLVSMAGTSSTAAIPEATGYAPMARQYTVTVVLAGAYWQSKSIEVLVDPTTSGKVLKNTVDSQIVLGQAWDRRRLQIMVQPVSWWRVWCCSRERELTDGEKIGPLVSGYGTYRFVASLQSQDVTTMSQSSAMPSDRGSEDAG